MADDADVAVSEMTPEESEVPSATQQPVAQVAQEATGGDQLQGDAPVLPWDPVSPEQLRQLEARARIRMADPEYQRRIRATDVLARRIMEGER